jgi:hypothetical protein
VVLPVIGRWIIPITLDHVANLTVAFKDHFSGRGISAESLISGENDHYRKQQNYNSMLCFHINTTFIIFIG